MTPEPDPEPGASPNPSPSRGVEVPTQAGLPIFDDENDEVSWLAGPRRAGAAAPAVRGATGAAAVREEAASLATRARTRDRWWRAATSTGRSTTSATERQGSRSLDELTDTHEQVPGRNWLRLAMLVAVALCCSWRWRSR